MTMVPTPIQIDSFVILEKDLPIETQGQAKRQED